MSKNVMAMLIVVVIAAGMFSVKGNSVSAVKCEDIKYEGSDALKWNDQPSTHNEPSEKKFFNMIFKNDATPCEVSKCYDHNQCEGVIDADEWKDFKQTAAYLGTTDDVEKCFEQRYNLPDDDGHKALKAYEYHHCQLGSY